jgi:hypothetical protein
MFMSKEWPFMPTRLMVATSLLGVNNPVDLLTRLIFPSIKSAQLNSFAVGSNVFVY